MLIQERCPGEPPQQSERRQSSQTQEPGCGRGASLSRVIYPETRSGSFCLVQPEDSVPPPPPRTRSTNENQEGHRRRLMIHFLRGLIDYPPRLRLANKAACVLVPPEGTRVHVICPGYLRRKKRSVARVPRPAVLSPGWGLDQLSAVRVKRGFDVWSRGAAEATSFSNARSETVSPQLDWGTGPDPEQLLDTHQRPAVKSPFI